MHRGAGPPEARNQPESAYSEVLKYFVLAEITLIDRMIPKITPAWQIGCAGSLESKS